MSSDRREFKRIPVEMWVEERRQGDTYFQRSTDISIGGIYLAGTIPHPRGTVVNLHFTLPGEDEPIVARAEVVGEPDEEHLGMHIRFLDLDSDKELAERIEAFVSKHEL